MKHYSVVIAHGADIVTAIVSDDRIRWCGSFAGTDMRPAIHASVEAIRRARTEDGLRSWVDRLFDEAARPLR